jgi:hypothetical protein
VFTPPGGQARVVVLTAGSCTSGAMKTLLQACASTLVVKAKHWFTAAAANDSAENTHLTVTIGAQCFTHVVTKKTD